MNEELTFKRFRAANVARCVKWHPEGIASWSPSDWLTAVTGELGELASLLKMRNRERDGLPGNKFSPTQKQIADELADVLTYLDLLAEVLGVDLAAAAVSKFNEVSERVGFPDRLEALAATTRGTEVPEEEGTDPAPPHSLPEWSECCLRVGNSEFINKRVSEGGYGPEPDSMLANATHRFIYEYDPAGNYQSGWFMHRLELMLNEVRSECRSKMLGGGA